MIKFFRKIRQKSIKGKKIINYLKYAIGEIVLVVIGILIALNINNRNGERLKKEKLDAIYIEVQRELALNIERITTAIDFFEKKDSMVYLILNDKLTKEDYIKKPILAHAIDDFTSIYIQNKGYSSLTENLDILPTSFNPILKKLNLVYERNNSALDETEENFAQFMLENVKNMSETKSWFFEFGYKGKLNNEILEYFVNDPFYKNKVFEYKIQYYNLSLQAVKLDAVEAYKALSEITGKKDGIAASIYFQTDEELSKYVGEFKINSDDALFNEEKGYNVIIFKVADGQLYAILFGKREIEIFPHAENIFILGEGDNAKFTFIQNENGQITGFQLFNNSVYTDWTRVI